LQLGAGRSKGASAAHGPSACQVDPTEVVARLQTARTAMRDKV